MPLPTYIYRRPETENFFFRFTIPVDARPLLGGKTEIKRTLRTTDRRFALRLARRLVVVIEKALHQLMSAKNNGDQFHLTAQLIERLADGTLRIEGLQMDPDPARAEEERKHLAALLGKTEELAPAAESYTLQQLVDDFMAEGDRAKRWTVKTRGELQATYNLLCEVVGAGKPVAQLTHKDFVRFKDMLCKLPSNMKKDARWRGKSVLELAGMSIPAADRLATNTINKLLTSCSSLMEWGAIHGHCTMNYAKGMTLSTGKRADEGRDVYTDEEVRILIDAAMSGAHGTDEAPWRKFIPLIGLYQGMRITEIAQLYVSDFSEVDGIPVVSINDDGYGKRLKNANSKRTIPVHPELVAAGLLQHVAELKRNGVERMWPELSLHRDGWGRTSRWFNDKLRPSLGLSKDFHATRHTFIHKLKEADCPEDVVGDLAGHSRSAKITYSTYAKAASVRRMHEALKRLSYSGASNVIPLNSKAA